MNIIKSIDRFWLLILLGVSVVYLLFEWSFNAFLVDQVYSFDQDVNFRNIEVRGRILAATGFSLLLVKAILPRLSLGPRRMFLALCAVAVGFPFAYFGQKALVEHLVNRTTAQERLEAQYLMLLKRGLSGGALQLEGLDFDKDEIKQVSVKTFVASIGFMTFFSPDFAHRLRSQVDVVLEAVANHEAHKAQPKVFDEYLDLQAKIRDYFDDYVNAMQEREDEIAKAENNAQEDWQEYYKKLGEQYQEQRELSAKYKLDLITSEFIDKFAIYQEKLLKCNGKSCDEFHAEYKKAIQEYFDRDIDPEYWCVDGGTRTVIERQGFVNVEREVPLSPVCDPLPFDHVQNKIIEMIGAAQDWGAFVTNQAVIDKAREKLGEEGLIMPEAWRVDDKDAFMSAYMNKATIEIDDAVQDKMREKFDATLGFDLNADSFIADPELQKRIKKEFGLEDSDPDLKLNMDARQILDDYLLPKAREKARDDKQKLDATAESFADGQENEKQGKVFVRVLLIPPVAMLFSLFFSAANLIEVIAGLTKFNPRISPTLRHGFQGVLILGLLMLPVLNPSPITQKASYQYFYDQTAETLSPMISYASRWMITAQPILYPVGKAASLVVDRIAPIELRKKELIQGDKDA